MKLKKIVLMIAAFLMLFSAAACDGEGGGWGGGGNGKRTTIAFYTWGNANDQRLMGEVKAAFETQYTDYKVDIEFASGGVYTDNVNQKISGNNAPDIFHVEPGNFAMFAKHGIIADLSALMTSAGLTTSSQFFEINDAYKYNKSTGDIGSGNYYAVIKDWSSTFALVFNKTLVSQYNTRTGPYAGLAGSDTVTIPEITVDGSGSVSVPTPLKWSEFLTAAQKLTRKLAQNSVYGTTLDYSYDIHIQEWAQMTGKSIYNADQKSLNVDNGALKSALQLFSDLQKGETRATPASSATDLGGEMFANGTVATAFYGSWAVPSYDWVTKGVDFGVSPAPLPDSLWGESAPRAMHTSSPVAMAVYAGTSAKKQEGAMKFIDFYVNEGAKIMAKSGFNIPASKKIAEDYYVNKDFIGNDTILKFNRIFLELGKNYTVVQEYCPNITSSAIKAQFDVQIGNYLEGKDPNTIDALAAKLKTEIDKKFEK